MGIEDTQQALIDYLGVVVKLRESPLARAVKIAAERLGCDPLGVADLYIPPVEQEVAPEVAAPSLDKGVRKDGTPRKRAAPRTAYTKEQYWEMVRPHLPGFQSDLARLIGVSNPTGGMKTALDHYESLGLAKSSRRRGRNSAGRAVNDLWFWEEVVLKEESDPVNQLRMVG